MVRRTTAGVILAALVARWRSPCPRLRKWAGWSRASSLDDKGQPVDGAKVTIDSGDTSRKFRNQDRQEGRVHPDRPDVGRLHGRRREGQARRPLSRQATVRAGSPAEIDLILGVASSGRVGRSRRQRRRADEGLRRRRGAQQGRQARRGDREVQRGHRAQPAAASTATTTSATAYVAEEGLRQGRSGLQEVHRAQAERRRRRTTGSPTSTTPSASSTSPRKPARRPASWPAGGAGGGGGNADALYNQGVILFNGGKIAEAKPLFEQVIAGQPGSRRSALHARHDARRRESGGRGHRVRDVSQARADGPERRRWRSSSSTR